MNTTEFRFAFYAHDFDKSVLFYQDTLGMKYIGGWDRPDGKGALLEVHPGSVIEIYGAAEGEIYDGESPVAINLAIRLPDKEAIDSLFSRISADGVAIIEPPIQRSWGHYSFVVNDPDAIPIHLYAESDP